MDKPDTLHSRADTEFDIDDALAGLGDDPTRQDLLALLHQHERALKYRGDHRALVELYESWYAVERRAERRAELLRQRAHLLETRLGQPDQALALLLEDYQLTLDSAVRPHLERLARATGRWSELVETLTHSVPDLAENDRADALLHIARLHAEQMGKSDEALEYLDIALEIEPGHAGATELSVALLREGEKWDALAAALEARAANARSPVTQSELLFELGELCETRLDDPRRALAHYRQAVQRDPGFKDARLAYESLLRRRRAYAELTQSLEERLSGSEDAERRVILRELASYFSNELAEPWRAIRYYEELRGDAPADLELLRALAALYRERNSLREYMDVLGAQLGVTESNRERAHLSREMARCWQELGSDAKAEECLEWALSYGGLEAETCAQLEAMYMTAERWHAAIDLLGRRAEEAAPGDRAALYCEIATLFEDKLSDPTSAIDFADRAQASEPCPPEIRDQALAGLTRMYELRGDFAELIDVLSQRAEHAERAERVTLLCRAGEAAVTQLRDRAMAETFFNQALAADPTCVAATRALAAVYLREGKPHKALPRIEDALALVDDGAERLALLIEAGEIHEALGRRVHAAKCYREALEVDSDNRDAAARLGEIYWATQRYDEARGLFAQLARAEAAQFEHVLRLGQCAAKCGNKKQAQAALRRAVRMAPDDFEVQLAYGGFLYQEGDWQRARHALRSVLEVLGRKRARRDSLASAELHYQVATCCHQLGLIDEARAHLQAACEAEPTHRPSLWLLCELDADNPARSLRRAGELLALSPDGEKARVLARMGQIHLDKLRDPRAAMEHYQRALEHQPGDHIILHLCIDALVLQKKWAETLAVLERLIADEDNPEVRAKYRYAQAMIHLEELDDRDTARALLWQALDDHGARAPSASEAGKALEQLLRRAHDWHGLAQYYVRALKELGPAADDGHDGERLRMWEALGDLCENKVNDPENALWAWEVVASLKPEPDLAVHQRLAELYLRSGGPEHRKKAIAQYQLLLRGNKGERLYYHKLEELYRQQGARVEALLCAEAGECLDAVAAGAELAAPDPSEPIALSGGVLDPPRWAQIKHPEEDALLSRLFTLVGPLFATMKALPPVRLGLHDAMLLGAGDSRGFAKLLWQITHAFAVTVPRAYGCPEQLMAARVVMLATSEGSVPALLVGRPILKNPSELEIAFHLARHIVLLHPALSIQNVFRQADELAAIIDAVLEMARERRPGEQPGDGKPRYTRAWLERALTPIALDQLVALGEELLARELPGHDAAAAWLAWSHRTAARAGLVVCGSVRAAVRAVAADPTVHMPAHDRIMSLPRRADIAARCEDVIWSSVTEEIFAARRYFGRWPAEPDPKPSPGGEPE